MVKDVTNFFHENYQVSVKEFLKQKGKFDYLPWPKAVQLLKERDPNATWQFLEHKSLGDTLMVYCQVNAFGVSQVMHLPVMDRNNRAISKPSSRDINDAMMRCLVKAIAVTTGIGLAVWTDETIEDDSKPEAKDAKSDPSLKKPESVKKEPKARETLKTSTPSHGINIQKVLEEFSKISVSKDELEYALGPASLWSLDHKSALAAAYNKIKNNPHNKKYELTSLKASTELL